jgi:hypothetical protein
VLYFFGTGILFLLPLLFPSKESWEVVQSVLFRNLFIIISGMTGILLLILKLFFPRGGVVVFGDFLPVLGLALCSILHFLGYVRVSRSLDQKLKERGSTILSGLQVPAGFVIIGLGIVHLLFAPIPVL